MPEFAATTRLQDLLIDLLFIEDADFYPSEMWEDFADAISLFLNAEEIELVNYRYGNEDFCSFEVGERRRILRDLFTRFRESRLFDEMNSVMSDHEGTPSAGRESSGLKLVSPLPENSVTDDSRTFGSEIANGAGDFVRSCLEAHGLEYCPGSAGEFRYDSKMGNDPVVVWRFSEYEMKPAILEDLLEKASENGFERLIVAAIPRLTADLPKALAGRIPYTFLPVIEDESSGAPASRGH
ncbi:MAG: hypothetical protein DWQ47_11375 [Acidobacteria bacterium]|nr:MAG: hypothetical protein DWQ32_13790 [Acidobacteriota bacterium]REJ98178.1 MAG: hypothetical protein DWQ38_16590 [Acidobacteriota bacterium]REK42832.1 MAG: hypothetical protein DWQ47_11375 [Acidobacteriota bacterium]